MVYDLGGGTFDVSILDISADVVEVLATAGNNHLGGDDFDQCVTDYLVDHFRASTGIDLTGDAVAMQRVREAAEKAKIELSGLMTTTVNLPFLTMDASGPKHMEITLTRAKFDEMTRYLVDSTMGPLQQALKDSGLTAALLASLALFLFQQNFALQVEQVERPDGEAFRGFDDKPLLAGLENVELLPFDEPFQRMAGKRRQRTADAPYLGVVFPGVHQLDVSRFEGSQPRCPAFEVHQMPMILLRMSIATPHAFAFSVIFDTRNLVSLYTRLSEYLLVADLRGSMM